ncbi:MAG: MarR family winged helix-turn-helix transcriptional regulator [Rhodospirillales bacterium]|jgi:DNA-binding MarR family transcriptional regulator|nr:MarR family winged helix-turn-helix transcriptional regulator [Rhodospirillales bacterium]
MNKISTLEKKVDFGHLPNYLGYQIRQAQTAIFRDFAGLMKDVGVTPGEFSLLTLLDANPGINQITLTRVYQLDKSTLSYAINGLKQRRLVKRVRDRDDRRYFSLWLTEVGREVLGRATERVEAQERAMDAVLRPGERAQLLDQFKRISGAFD